MLPRHWSNVGRNQSPKRISILSEEVKPGCRRNLAKAIGVSRTSLYCPTIKQIAKDTRDIEELKTKHISNPFYGVRRLAIDLGWSVSKTRRIRNLAKIKALHRSKKHRYISGRPEISAPVNQLKRFWLYKDPKRPQDGYNFVGVDAPNVRVWVQDFTYIWWKGSFYYLAVTLNLSTREVVGWALSRFHDADLVCDALLDALAYHAPPEIVHNDRGTEYMSQKHAGLCGTFGIQMSASSPSSPWQNGFMERFFSTFKDECLSKIVTAEDVGEIYEMIARWIRYYNHERIHTTLKMSPAKFAEQLLAKKKESISIRAT